MTAFVLTALLLLGFTPFLSARAAENPNYIWNISEDKISTIDVSGKFGAYTGSFVLYDLQKTTGWSATERLRLCVLRPIPPTKYTTRFLPWMPGSFHRKHPRFPGINPYPF